MQSKLAPNPVMLRRTESCAALRAAASLCRTQLNSPREHAAAGNSSIAQIPNRTRGNKPSTSDSLDAEHEQCDKRSVGSGRVLTTSSLQVWVQIAFCKSCTTGGRMEMQSLPAATVRPHRIRPRLCSWEQSLMLELLLSRDPAAH